MLEPLVIIHLLLVMTQLLLGVFVNGVIVVGTGLHLTQSRTALQSSY